MHHFCNRNLIMVRKTVTLTKQQSTKVSHFVYYYLFNFFSHHSSENLPNIKNQISRCEKRKEGYRLQEQNTETKWTKRFLGERRSTYHPGLRQKRKIKAFQDSSLFFPPCWISSNKWTTEPTSLCQDQMNRFFGLLVTDGLFKKKKRKDHQGRFSSTKRNKFFYKWFIKAWSLARVWYKSCFSGKIPDLFL